MKTGGWFGDLVKCSEEVKTECVGEYNKAMMDKLTPIIGYILVTLQVPAIIACVLCYKYRHIADYFFHAEHFMQFLSVLHLNYSNYNDDYRERQLGSLCYMCYIACRIALK